MSQYLILIYDDAWTEVDEQTRERVRAGHRQFAEKNRPAILGGNALQHTSTATSVRSDGAGGFAVTDGPFLETKEALGGYYLVEAADLDEALELAKQIPLATPAGGVEVRPIQVIN